MKSFFLFLFAFSFGAYSQLELSVKHDSLMTLRYDNVVVFHKKKVGVYNTRKNAFEVSMTKGIGFVYKDFNRWDGLIIKGKKWNKTFLLGNDYLVEFPSASVYRDVFVLYDKALDTFRVERFLHHSMKYDQAMIFQGYLTKRNILVKMEDKEHPLNSRTGLYNVNSNSWVYLPDSVKIYSAWLSYLRDNNSYYDFYDDADGVVVIDSIYPNDNIFKLSKYITPFNTDSSFYLKEFNSLIYFSNQKEGLINIRLFDSLGQTDFLNNHVFRNEHDHIIPLDTHLIITYNKGENQALGLFKYNLLDGDIFPDSLVSFNILSIKNNKPHDVDLDDIGVLDGYYPDNISPVYIDHGKPELIEKMNDLVLFSNWDLFEITLLDSNTIQYIEYKREIHDVIYDEWEDQIPIEIPGYGNSGIYLMDQRKWISPENCMYIVPIASGGYLYNTVENEGSNYYKLDENGKNPTLVSMSEDYYAETINPDFVLGDIWDSIVPIKYHEMNQEFVQYYTVYKGGKQAIFDNNNYQEFSAHSPYDKPADFVYYYRSHNLRVLLNADTLSVVMSRDSLLFKSEVPNRPHTFMIDFSNPNHFECKIDNAPDDPSKLDYLLLTFMEDEILADAPEIIEVEGFDYDGFFYYYAYNLRQSTVFKKKDNVWVQELPYFSRLTQYPFGYIAETGGGFIESEFYDMYEDSPNDIPDFDQIKKYLLFNNDCKSLIYFDFVDYDKVNDIGFGLQIFINELSFFMTYEGKVLTTCEYEKFELEDGKVIGLVYDKSNEFITDDFETYYLPLKRDVFELE